MIRPFTLITAMLFVLSGAYLFAVTHRAQVLNDELAATAAATRDDESRIRVLQAQWALEADPSRLAQLAAQFTTLQPMKPSQLVTLAALQSDLPAPGSAPPAPNPEDFVPPMPVASAPPAAAPIHVTPQMSAVPPVASAPPQIAAPAKLETVELLLRKLPAHHHPHAHHVIAPPVDADRGDEGSALAYQGPALPPPAPISPAPEILAVRAVSTVPQAAPVAPPLPPDGGSMLGMAQTGSSN